MDEARTKTSSFDASESERGADKIETQNPEEKDMSICTSLLIGLRPETSTTGTPIQPVESTGSFSSLDFSPEFDTGVPTP